ncbi:bifunctional (p)ppGpp synthetase/guanosine-3',5'-bis(diphosphate) 3'-pyrophosphohydrolase [Christensenellaceae bacterium NSJ-53]|uniref:GTP diphosphokinase n=1 Tax=Gehongia tenuis TaxID=2763655 RepID=A0A926HNX5_9FIRM|nr:bifunctional (p)ppGpp synthetase/guanosine-3',5'-bis(diphosphate) 3'-pyrophosphohydrolase [Gehongia tenuis]
MEELQHLLDKIRENYPDEDLKVIEKAYRLAETAHTGQLRASGEPYFVHPYGVAVILTDLGLDVDTIAAGLLHDVVEDTPVTLEEITDEFGSEIASLVDGVTKLSRFEFRTKEEQQAETYRKMFLAMAKDIRVILIKLADRLHNMRTLEHLKNPDKAIMKAKETLEIYAPLAHRLGIYRLKVELEDRAFSFLEPEAYKELIDKMSAKFAEREDALKEAMGMLRTKLDEMHIHAEIEGRPKHYYSIYKKMKTQNKTLDQIFDLIAVRVIVDTVKDCYAVLGTVHTLWKPIPGRFKDYIAVPKPNMYQSLHTTLISRHGNPFEIQIRTFEMHRTSEYGIAAHWKYKEGRSNESSLDMKLAWLRQILEWQDETKDAREFMDTLKIDLYSDEVFVYTPKGDVINLPKGATPLDFAYSIHSAIGNKCVGAKISGKIVPLDYHLKTGDIVEVLTSSSTKGPSMDWLKVVVTSQARNKIRAWFKKQNKEENVERGKDMLEKEARRHGCHLSDLNKPEWMDDIVKKYSMTTADDIYAAVGYGGLTSNQVLSRLLEYYKKARKMEIKKAKAAENSASRNSASQGVIVKGEHNMLVRFSKCCNPLPGDDIVGYITRGRGVSIHRRDCANLNDLAADVGRMVDVEWESDAKTSYQADIQLLASDHPGLLANIFNMMAQMNINITAINARTNKNGTVVVNLTLEITSVEILEKVMKTLKRMPETMEVFRGTT